MINLEALREQAHAGSAEERVPVTRRMLQQMVRELEQGRAAVAARYGQEQLDAVLNNIRYERPLGERVVIDAADGA